MLPNLKSNNLEALGTTRRLVARAEKKVEEHAGGAQRFAFLPFYTATLYLWKKYMS